MAAVSSTMLALGTKAPPFSLPDTRGKTVSLDDLAEARALLVIFMCNHCPYVRHVRDALVSLARDYRARGVAVVAINSNDVSAYPEDAPGKMAEEARRWGYTFPYLYDETQEVAEAYRAACTPDFFLFDSGRELVYRGQVDDSRPSSGQEATGRDLREALDAVLQGERLPERQNPSMGCNIKWKPGSEPEYFKR